MILLTLCHETGAKTTWYAIRKKDLPAINLENPFGMDYIHEHQLKKYSWNIAIKTSVKRKHSRASIVILERGQKYVPS